MRLNITNATRPLSSGTGYWLTLLSQTTSQVFGMDYSFGMLQQAQKQPAPLKLSRGTAIQLPYQNESFDMLYCVDAIRHFVNHQASSKRCIVCLAGLYPFGH